VYRHIVHPPDGQTHRKADIPTDGPTDGIDHKPVATPAYAVLYYSDAAKNHTL